MKFYTIVGEPKTTLNWSHFQSRAGDLVHWHFGIPDSSSIPRKCKKNIQVLLLYCCTAVLLYYCCLALLRRVKPGPWLDLASTFQSTRPLSGATFHGIGRYLQAPSAHFPFTAQTYHPTTNPKQSKTNPVPPDWLALSGRLHWVRLAHAPPWPILSLVPYNLKVL